MITDLIRHSGLTTKIRSMEGRLITYDGYYMLANSVSLFDFAKKLLQYESYYEVIDETQAKYATRLSLERNLAKSMYKDYSNIYDFIVNINDRKYLDSRFLKFEIGIIKTLLRRLFDKRRIEHVVQPDDKYIERHLRIDVSRLTHSKNYEEFLYNLSDTKFHSVLSKIDIEKNPSLFSIETQLDIFCFMEAWDYQYKYLSGIDVESTERINGADIDLNNIMHIYRLKTFYEIDDSLIYSFLIPINYKIKKDVLIALINSQHESGFHDIIDKTYYRNVFKKSGGSDMKRDYDLFMYKIHSEEAKKYPYSMAVVSSYLYKKSLELRNITTMVECVMYGLNPDETIAKLSVEPKKAAV